MAKKLTWYRLHTRCPKMPLYTINDSEAWQAILKKGKEGKLGNIPGTNYPITPEMLYKEEMLLETFVDETDDEGMIDIDLNNKAFVKFVLMTIKHLAAVPVGDEKNADKAVPRYMAYFRTVLDKNSPQDVLDEIEEELRFTLSPEARRQALEKKRADAKAPTK